MFTTGHLLAAYILGAITQTILIAIFSKKPKSNKLVIADEKKDQGLVHANHIRRLMLPTEKQTMTEVELKPYVDHALTSISWSAANAARAGKRTIRYVLTAEHTSPKLQLENLSAVAIILLDKLYNYGYTYKIHKDEHCNFYFIDVSW